MIQQSRSVSPHQRQVLRRRAQRMRHEPTQSEWLLWSKLCRGQQGVVFRRRVVLRGYWLCPQPRRRVGRRFAGLLHTCGALAPLVSSPCRAAGSRGKKALKFVGDTASIGL